MPIDYSEVSSSGITSGEFNTLSAQVANIDKEVKIYRQYPAFNNNIGVIGGRATGLLFSAAGNGSGIVRAFIDGGHLYAEHYTTGGGWTATTDLGAILSIRPKVFIDSNGYNILAVISDGSPTIFTSAAGTSWSAGTATSTVNLPTDGTAEWIAYGGGALPIVYAVIKQSAGARKIEAIDATTSYDLGMYWPSQIFGFDCEHIIQPQDNAVSNGNTDLRHILTLAVRTPSIYTFKTVGGLPQKVIQATGGLVSFIIRPPNSGRLPAISYYYPIHVSDNYAVQNRTTCHLTPSSSIYGSDSHDTLFCVAYGQNGDANSADPSYSYPVIAYYSSRDGKHWSQDALVEISDVSGTLPNIVNGAQIVSYSANLYLLTCEGMIASPGCLEWNNPDSNETMDITERIASYNSSFYETRQTTIEVVNRDGVLNNSILMSGISCAMITKFGGHVASGEYKFQVAIEDIDSIQPSRTLPREMIEISARDRMAWINDRSQSADAIQWDNQIIGRDNFINIGGVANSGLAHTATVKGTFATENNVLKAINNFNESIAFNTFKAAVRDGHCAAVFSLPNPTGPNPSATSTDSPTYGGVVFRAIDKDNLWMVRYNYWTNKIEVVERRAGTDSILASITPSSGFSTNGQNGLFIGLRVEFKGARIHIFESTNYYTGVGGIFNGADYSYDYEYIIGEDTLSNSQWLEGYVGVIGCGYSSEDSSIGTGLDIPPSPIIVGTGESAWGSPSTLSPTQGYILATNGQVYKASGLPNSPTYASLGANPTTIIAPCVSPDPLGQGIPYKMIADPYNYKSLIVIGALGIYWTNDATVGSPTWNKITPTLPSPFGGNSYGIYDITGSINRQNFFMWLVMCTVSSGNEPMYIQWTDDKFTTVHTVSVGYGPIRLFNDGNYPTICQWCFNGGSTGVFYIQSAYGLYRTNDWGQSWTNINASYGLMYQGGLFSLGYSRVGGGNNDGSEADRLKAAYLSLGDNVYFTYPSHVYMVRGYSLPASYVYKTDVVSAIGNHINNHSANGLNIYTLDSNYAAIAGGTGDNGVPVYILRTTDGGITWTKKSTGLLAGTVAIFPSVNGWPTNPNWYIYNAFLTLCITLDGGDTWIDLTTSWTNSVGSAIVCAMADLASVYSSGGIHP